MSYSSKEADPLPALQAERRGFTRTIVIPTFNERDNVYDSTSTIASVMHHHDINSYDIWFIDDSVDDTPEVLSRLADEYPNVHFVHRETERGLATAVVEGIRRSSGEYVIVMDSDLQHPPEMLPVICKRLQEGIEIVIQSRFVSGGTDGGLNKIRKLVSWTARFIGQLSIKRLRHI